MNVYAQAAEIKAAKELAMLVCACAADPFTVCAANRNQKVI